MIFYDILRVYYFLAILETKKSCLIILSFLEYLTFPMGCFSWLILDSSKSQLAFTLDPKLTGDIPQHARKAWDFLMYTSLKVT